ncbi:MAG TPA: hypothetical protein ENK31_09070, partial [Nannocystis exedens]|nr:hypothetical protein [Nannocystis exedens]
MFTGCISDDGTATGATDTSSDTDTDSETGTTTNTTNPTTTNTTQTTAPTTSPTSESDTDATATATDTDATATDTDATATDTDVTATDTNATTTTGPECVENTDCADGEMCTEGMCVPLESNLCLRLGEMEGINLLNTDFVNKVLNDQKINGYFLNDDVDGANLIGCLDKQIGAAAECPDVVYDCLDMLTTHAGMGISAQDFGDLATDYSLALDDHQTNNAPDLTDEDKTAILDILGSMAPDIIEDATDDATVYQRVGRKPAILTLIGKPGEVDSFVDNVAMDPEINGFFGNSDFDRLNTCLTRQVSSIDGPILYSQEVDSPGEGIDIGVSLDNQCMNMCDTHAGMVDDMDSPITVVDFAALVNDLVTAMTTAGITDEDQAAILSVLGPMCTSIVSDPLNCPGIPVQQIEGLAEGLALDVPDNGYDGTLGSMACTPIEILDPGDEFKIFNDLTLEIAMSHTWVGDLTIKVAAPDDSIVTVLSRPDFAEAADDGTGCCGDSANLVTASPLLYNDSFANDAEKMGKDPNQSFFNICADDDVCEFFGNPDKGPGVNFADFAGMDV